MSDEPTRDQPSPNPPCVVCLIDPTQEQVHDGFALASFLRVGGVPCVVARFNAGDLKTEVARRLGEVADKVVFFAAGDNNLQQVQRVAGLLNRPLVASLFGREMADPKKREQVACPPVSHVLVGEPYVPARDLARKVLARPQAHGDVHVAGAFRPDARFVPLAPMSDINVVPPGDYGGFEALANWAVPLHATRCYPHPLIFSARRQWEQPVRCQRPERVVGDLARYQADFGARHFVFTGMAANGTEGWLQDVAHRILDQGLDVSWYARLWPDPALDRAAVHTMAASGCRGLEVELFSASGDLAEQLCTGVELEAVDSLMEHCRQEGIPARPRLVVGFPQETDEDRLATQVWLARQAGRVDEVARLEACRIRHGAPLYWHPDVYFPADRAHDQWHDGGENNHSKRTVWLGEMAAWVDHLKIRRRGGPAGLNPATQQGVCRRISEKVDQQLREDPAWKRDRLVLCGVMHGREAFCGPQTLHLDLAGMDPAVALRLVHEAASMGARELALADVLGCDFLDDLLTVAREVGLRITLRLSLDGGAELDADRLRQVTAGVQQVELEAHTEQQWEQVDRWLPVMAQARADRFGALPQINLRVWLDEDTNGPRAVVERATRLGADRLVLSLQREESGRLGADRLASAREELSALLDDNTYGVPVFAPQSAHLEFWRAVSHDGVLLALDSGWPPGFTLSRADGGAWACTCPAGATTRRLHGRCSDPSAAYATFDEPTCRVCEMQATCPVHRQDCSVRVGLLLLEGASGLLEDLADMDSGLGRAQANVDAEPCLVGWTEARVDATGDLFICAECGSEAVGNVAESPLATVWYSRELNEFRRMTLGASLALPYVDRRLCGLRCARMGDNLALMEHLRDLPDEARNALEEAGAGDRLGM